MVKRVLMVATVPSMIGQFNINNIHLLLNLGYSVDVASDFSDNSVWPENRIIKFKEDMKNLGIECIQLNFSRNPLKLSRHIASYKEALKLLENKKYSFIHTHTPIASAIIRIAAHKTRTKIIYTAHGFHFYKGAPLRNWIIFYPIEKLLSKYTDILITINQEDYRRALDKFKAKKTLYIPGVGVDTKKFAPETNGRKKIRAELGLDNDRLMLLSVGEVNQNNNYESVIRAIQGLNITYVIVGKSEAKESFELVAKECAVDLRLIETRTDISDFYDAADVYILPGICKEVNISLIEAMASGVAVACANIKENKYFIENMDVLFDPTSITEIKTAIKNAITHRDTFAIRNLEKIKNFSFKKINSSITDFSHTCEGKEHLQKLLLWQNKRNELGIPKNSILLISVGELSVRKNHSIIIKTLNEINNEKIYYAIVGKGALGEKLKEIDKTSRLLLLGYRNDIVDLLHIADIFVFPSLQEGLPVSLMEAMASGLPCIASKIRGNVDLINNSAGNALVNPNSVIDIKQKLTNLLSCYTHINNQNLYTIRNFDIANITHLMKNVYSEIL